jgi:hypothetical protein
MKNQTQIAWMILPALVALSTAPALAQERRLEKSYFAVELMLGLGGEADIEPSLASGEDDMLPSWGAGLQYTHRLHRHFALGALLGFQSWQTEGLDETNVDRSVLFDFALVPAGVFPLSRDVELYLALRLGLSMDFLGADEALSDISGQVAEIDPAVGPVVAPLIGVRFALSDDFGVLAELGYALHWYEHEASVSGLGSYEFELSLAQIALNLGVFF